jgi:hypothetical protein
LKRNQIKTILFGQSTVMNSYHFGLCAECTFPEFEPAYETH